MTNRYIEITDLTDDDHFIIDTKTNKKITYEDSIKLMNKLSDENEQLKKENELVDGIIRQNTHLQNDLNNAKEHIQLLKEENEQLKSVNQELRNELKFDEKMYKTFKEIIDEADDLITSHLSKHYQKQWKNFCKHRGVLDD